MLESFEDKNYNPSYLRILHDKEILSSLLFLISYIYFDLLLSKMRIFMK